MRRTFQFGGTAGFPSAAAVTPLLAVIAAAAITLTGCGRMVLLDLIEDRVLESGYGSVVYVSPSGDARFSGLSPDHPVPTIPGAMANAVRYAATQIHVAEGRYDVDTDSRIPLHSGITVRGGYNGTFSGHDPTRYHSVIVSTTTAHQLVTADAVQNGVLENLEFEVTVSGTEPGTDVGRGIVAVRGSSSLSILNNIFRVNLSSAYDDPGIVIAAGSGDSADLCELLIHGNDILLTSETTGDQQITALSFANTISPSEVTITANRITVFGDAMVTGVWVGECSGTTFYLYNNIISVSGSGAVAGFRYGSGGITAELVHNTIVAANSGSDYTSAALLSGSEYASTIEASFNIFASPGSAGIALYNEQSTEISAGTNLTFGFAGATFGLVSGTDGGRYVPEDIFDSVFSSAYDSDFSDGDDSDYHLNDTGAGGPYAVDQGSMGSWKTSIDFDGDPRPKGTAIDLGAYESDLTASWVTTIVDGDGDNGRFSSIAIDSNGRPCISYYDASDGNLKYAHRDTDGITWNIESVDGTTSLTGQHTSLVFHDGQPHISYYDGFSRNLRYAVWNGTSWDTTTVDSGTSVGEYTSIAFDSVAKPNISYFDFDAGALKFARFDGTSWITETVDASGMVGTDTSLAIGPDGRARISYHDYGNGRLKYARWDGSAWHIETVDPSTVAGRGSSLDLDSDGYPHISYHDTANGRVKYARWDGSVWHFSVVEDTGNGGDVTSIVLDSADYPHISYHDPIRGDLKYAYWNGTSWHIDTADQTDMHDMGYYSSVELDANEKPHIAYFDDTSLTLCYAWWGVHPIP